MLVCVRVRACACVRVRVRARVCGHVHDFSVPFTTPLPALSRTHLLVDNHCSFCLSFYYSIFVVYRLSEPIPFWMPCLVDCCCSVATHALRTATPTILPQRCHHNRRCKNTLDLVLIVLLLYHKQRYATPLQHHCVCVCWSTYYASTSTSVVGIPVRSCHNPIIIILPILAMAVSRPLVRLGCNHNP